MNSSPACRPAPAAARLRAGPARTAPPAGHVARPPRDAARLHAIALPASYELTLHAWDINRTTGCRTPLPPTLVEALLALAPLVVDGVDRTDLFAAPLPPPHPADPTDRLLALFGRRADPAA